MHLIRNQEVGFSFSSPAWLLDCLFREYLCTLIDKGVLKKAKEIYTGINPGNLLRSAIQAVAILHRYGKISQIDRKLSVQR
jgi:hypothetical protein